MIINNNRTASTQAWNASSGQWVTVPMGTLQPLSLSQALTVASELHSQDMADHNYFSHTSLDGRTPTDRMRAAGYTYNTWLGENIAAGFTTASSVFNAWYGSIGHRANMLCIQYKALGIGLAYNASSTYGWYWTTDFGGYDDTNFFHTHTEFWFTWYDLVNAQTDNIHFVNPGTSTATITVYIAGVNKGSFSLAAGQSIYRNYAGVVGGPVKIVSNQPIWCTQRIVGWGSFKEVSGLPGDMASTEIYYTWYDMKFAGSDAIHFLNPSGTQTAHVDVYIAGVKKTPSPITIGPGQATFVTYPGVIGGPVRIVSDVPIFSTQRIVGWSDFDEVVGMPSWYVFGENWFNWYDSAGASIDNIHFINPGSSIANIQVYVGGVLRGSYALDPGAANYVNYPSLTGGPVRVVSDQPIWVTQRIVGWNGFKEEFSVPTQHMSKKWFFNWYDNVNAQTDNIHLLNPGTSAAHVSVKIAGTSYGPYTIPAGGAYYVSFPGVCNGPVIIESDVPIMTSQRIIGWNSFEETLGVPWG